MTELQWKKIRNFVIGAGVVIYVGLLIISLCFDALWWLFLVAMAPTIIISLYLLIYGCLSSLAQSIIDWRARGIFTEDEYKFWEDFNSSYLAEKTYPLERWADWMQLCKNAELMPFWIREKFNPAMDMENIYYSTWKKSAQIKYPKFYEKMLDWKLDI